MANIGPLESFVFPGVYTKTLLEPPTVTASGALRYPAFIGVGKEEVRTTGFGMVRGSSAISDNIIVGEIPVVNMTVNVVDGTNQVFVAKHFPLVSGNGKGVISNSISSVIVLVNSEPAIVTAVDGLKGEITLAFPPQTGDLVELSYYFKRRDTRIVGEDLTAQADGTAVTFKVESDRIVNGNNGGTTVVTTDIGGTVQIYVGAGTETQMVPVISVQVNNTPVTISSLNGAAATFTLAAAPASGATVRVTYFTNTWQNTFDILPAADVTAVVKSGYDPGSSDFIVGKDCVLANKNELHWGNSSAVLAGLTTDGSTVFGPTQVSSTLVDDKLYKMLIEDSTVAGAVSFTLPYTPVKGDGLGVEGATPADVQVYVGATLAAATLVTVSKVVGSVVYLQTAPATGSKVFATFYRSRLIDDTWTLTNKVAGAATSPIGEYTVVGAKSGVARQVTVVSGTHTLLEDPIFINPSPVYVDETITIAVAGAGTFTVTSNVAGQTGSDTSSNTGSVGQTYIDAVTGFTISLATAAIGNIVLSTASQFKVITDFNWSLPGVRFLVTNTTGVAIGDTATLLAMNMSSDGEPNVGDPYYVTFDQERQDYSVKFLTRFQDVTQLFGPLSQDNPLVVGAYLAFLNGAPAVALKQIQRAPGSQDATTVDYIDAIDSFNEPLVNGTRPSVLVPLTTNYDVISYLRQSNAQQSSIRYRNERTSYFGFPVGTLSSPVINRVSALQAELLTAIYPDGGVIAIETEGGVEKEVLFGGEMLAAAMAGLDTSNVMDVATPLTNKSIVGFRRLTRRLDNVTASLVANAGCTVLENKSGDTRILMALTTDLTSVLTRDPRVVEVKHFVQKGMRTSLNPFIGRKFVGAITSDVETTTNNYLTALRSAKIIAAFKGVRATRNPQDPTTIDVEAFYSPVLPVNWVLVTLNLSSVL